MSNIDRHLINKPTRNGNPPVKSMALRRGLPYGAVMATAGASAVAGACGWRFWSAPLLLLAIVQAAWIPLYGTWRYRADFRLGWPAWLVLGPAREHAGIHTLPLGIAVIAGELAGLRFGEEAVWAFRVTAVYLGLAWPFTLLCVDRFIASLAVHGLELSAVDGSWFLVPAALLGTGIATGKAAAQLALPPALMLASLAFTAALLGGTGYWLVAAAAGLRLLRFGLRGAPRAPWWISMGCAGLAAAALARLLANPVLSGLAHTFLSAAVAIAAVTAIALFVPMAAGGLLFLLTTCRFRAKAPWPPTFSTAVFALGCLQAAKVLHSHPLHWLGLAASAATLLFWAVTAGWNTVFRPLRTNTSA